MIIGLFIAPGSPRRAEAALLTPERGPAFVEESPTADAMIAILRTPLEILWVDLVVLGDDIRTIRQIRLQRPDLRILVGYDDTLRPPHPLLGQLVALGIYDLIPSSQSLHDALAHRANYADAARWHSDPAIPSSSRTPTEAIFSPAATGRYLWHKHLTGQEGQPAPRRPDRLRIVRPRRILVLGSHGGVGTSSIVVALAKAWAGIGLRVAVVDVAQHGGWLPLAWAGEPVDSGWDAGPHPEDAWRLVSPQTYLLAQSGLQRGTAPSPEGPCLGRLQEALGRSPIPPDAVWIIDGGATPGWMGGLRTFIDGTILVTSATTQGQYAGARQRAILAAGGAPLLGIVVTRHHGTQPKARDIAESWRTTALAQIADQPAVWDAVWNGEVPAAVRDALAPVAHQLIDSEGALNRKKGWMLS